MAEEPLYGAFGDILTLDDTENNNTGVDDFTYGVYQLATQKPDVSQQDLQKTYGTGAMPIFEWVKTIQTGTRQYDPMNPDDRAKLDEFKRLGTPPGFMTPEEIEKQMIADTAIGISGTIGAGAGEALATGQPVFEGIKSAFGVGNLTSDLLKDVGADRLGKTARAQLQTKDLIYNEALANEDVARATGNIDVFNKIPKTNRELISGKGDDAIFAYKADGDMIKGLDKTEQVNVKGNFQNYTGSNLPEKAGYWDRVKADATSTSTLGASGGAGVATFFTDLLLTKGKDPAKSAKKGAGASVGTYVGSVLGGPIGGAIGATVGASLGGRVICNELRRHGLMTSEDILIDYYFTQKHLTPTHVNGYHIWAISVVRKMREGKSVKLWHHIANHRLNEVKYILGKRDKPDYLGKIYRFIGESICFILGKFCKKTDWSILYNKKEI
jgi:hypothetical protein